MTALNSPEATANRLERAIRDLENILRAQRVLALVHNNEKASEGKLAVEHTETQFEIVSLYFEDGKGSGIYSHEASQVKMPADQH